MNRKETSRPQTGFTLIELMIAVVIAGILAAVAYPSFVSYVQKARRADAKAALLAAAQKMGAVPHAQQYIWRRHAGYRWDIPEPIGQRILCA